MNQLIIEKLKAKNRKAQYEFYSIYSQKLFLIAFRYVTSEHDAGIIVNAGFFKIFDNINTVLFINEQSFCGWMKKIVINEALMFLRQKMKYDDIDKNVTENNYSDSDIESTLTHEDYYQIIQHLPEDLRTVFNLYAIDGYSHKEIATILNIQESSSRVYLTRARKELREKITKNENQ